LQRSWIQRQTRRLIFHQALRPKVRFSEPLNKALEKLASLGGLTAAELPTAATGRSHHRLPPALVLVFLPITVGLVSESS
jgi:hypothetical protein